jgi:hypothetical protein
VALLALHFKDSQFKKFIIFSGFGVTTRADQIENIIMKLLSLPVWVTQTALFR